VPVRDRPFGTWGARFYAALGALAGVLMALLTLAVFLQVILRYVARSGIEGLDEAPRYLFVWLVMLGAAAAMYWGEHTALEFFRGRMSSRGRALAKILTEGVGILLFLSMIKASLVLVPNSQLQSSPGLGLPLGYVYAAVPVGAALIILPMAWRLTAALRELWQRPF
jgi:TRAP-type transport system small permease protein